MSSKKFNINIRMNPGADSGGGGGAPGARPP